MQSQLHQRQREQRLLKTEFDAKEPRASTRELLECPAIQEMVFTSLFVGIAGVYGKAA